MSYLTKQGLTKYKKELDDLIEALPAMIRETGAMAALGDRSENAGYINAKATMRKTQARIRYLEDLIKHAIVIENKNLGKVDIGSSVIILNNTTNKTENYTIVDSLEADPSKNLVSFHSPLGSLLMGKEENTVVLLVTPHFTTEYKIISID